MTCETCGQGIVRARPSGRPPRFCQDCRRRRQADSKAAWRDRNPDYFRDHYQANAEREKEQQRTYWHANRDVNLDKLRTRWAARYGLTREQYDELAAGPCAICGATEPGGRGRFHIDHDHTCCPTRQRSCGRCIRGALCASCNMRLTQPLEQWVRSAAVYLGLVER
jgi:hypothetical protein